MAFEKYTASVCVMCVGPRKMARLAFCARLRAQCPRASETGKALLLFCTEFCLFFIRVFFALPLWKGARQGHGGRSTQRGHHPSSRGPTELFWRRHPCSRKGCSTSARRARWQTSRWSKTSPPLRVPRRQFGALRVRRSPLRRRSRYQGGRRWGRPK